MGKSLVILGADFSENGMPLGKDIVILLGAHSSTRMILNYNNPNSKSYANSYGYQLFDESENTGIVQTFVNDTDEDKWFGYNIPEGVRISNLSRMFGLILPQGNDGSTNTSVFSLTRNGDIKELIFNSKFFDSVNTSAYASSVVQSVSKISCDINPLLEKCIGYSFFLNALYLEKLPSIQFTVLGNRYYKLENFFSGVSRIIGKLKKFDYSGINYSQTTSKPLLGSYFQAGGSQTEEIVFSGLPLEADNINIEGFMKVSNSKLTTVEMVGCNASAINKVQLCLAENQGKLFKNVNSVLKLQTEWASHPVSSESEMPLGTVEYDGTQTSGYVKVSGCSKYYWSK